MEVVHPTQNRVLTIRENERCQVRVLRNERMNELCVVCSHKHPEGGLTMRKPHAPRADHPGERALPGA
jgi:hypothetical protein